MKHTFLKRVLSAVLLTAILATMLASAIPAYAEGNIASDQAVTRPAFSQEEMATHTPRAFTEGEPVGMRLNFGAPFTKFTVCMPTWNDTTTTFTMSLYQWDTDFETSRTGTPVARKTYKNHPDNGHAELSFDEAPAGEYLICIDEFSGGRLGVWKMEPRVGNGFAYDAATERAEDWEIQVTFSKTPINAFLPVESIVNAIYGKHTYPPEAIPSEDALVNTHKVMPDTWVFTDGLGRESLTYEDVGAPKDDKTVAMFYWTWHVDLAIDQPLNINNTVEKHPEAQNDFNHSVWPKSGTAYFWNEPIWGYYRTNDAWVLRRQAELLANAGVDTIFTDNTNGNYTWRSSYIPLYEAWSDALENGAVNVPKVSYLLPFASTSGSVEQIESLYLDIYRPGKYQNLWFYWDDQPMLMAHNDTFYQSEGLNNLRREIRKFFTWRSGQPGYIFHSTDSTGRWGWLSTYPQAIYYGDRGDLAKEQIEQMTVGVSVNHSYGTNKITAMNGTQVMGRSYTSTYQDRFDKEGKDASKYGYFFSEQFDYALEKDPNLIFITGWNEWTAGRYESWADISNGFPDQFNDEYSRDIEPTKGALKDHYYYLLVNYVRKYKGCNPIPVPSVKKTIDLAAGTEQWANVEPYYAAYIGNTEDRNAKGYGDLVYTETSGRNDIIGAQVARDDEYVYFHVECAEDITPYTDKLWMNLYIDSDQDNKGWETFDFIVNKSAASAETLVLEKFTGEGYATEKVAEVPYTQSGKYLTVKIAKSALGLEGNDYTINFAWTDNVHDEGDDATFSGDIMDFYISGDVAPGARFKYSYISTAENAGVSDETQADTTVGDTGASADSTASGTEPADSEKGCQSALGSAAVLAMAIAAGYVWMRKKEA